MPCKFPAMLCVRRNDAYIRSCIRHHACVTRVTCTGLKHALIHAPIKPTLTLRTPPPVFLAPRANLKVAAARPGLIGGMSVSGGDGITDGDDVAACADW